MAENDFLPFDDGGPFDEDDTNPPPQEGDLDDDLLRMLSQNMDLADTNVDRYTSEVCLTPEGQIKRVKILYNKGIISAEEMNRDIAVITNVTHLREEGVIEEEEYQHALRRYQMLLPSEVPPPEHFDPKGSESC